MAYNIISQGNNKTAYLKEFVPFICAPVTSTAIS